MFIIRPIELKDLDTLEEFALKSHLGLYNLPKDRKLLENYVNLSLQSFADVKHKLPYERYLFVAEDSTTKNVVGTSSIKVIDKDVESHCFFRLATLPQKINLPQGKDITILMPICHRDGITEVGGLYLLPEYRKEHIGKLLALTRYLYMSLYVGHFGPTISVIMRGVAKDNTTIPFWEGWGRHFLDVPFSDVQELLQHDPEFPNKMLPAYPLYLSFLPKDAQDAIGKIHAHTQPALAMLMHEGFQLTSEIDLFDGAPTLSARFSQIRTIKNHKKATVQTITTKKISVDEELLIANRHKNAAFRSCMGQLLIDQNQRATISDKVAKALGVTIGDTIAYISIR